METLETHEERSEAPVHSVNSVSFRRLRVGGLVVAGFRKGTVREDA